MAKIKTYISSQTYDTLEEKVTKEKVVEPTKTETTTTKKKK